MIIEMLAGDANFGGSLGVLLWHRYSQRTLATLPNLPQGYFFYSVVKEGNILALIGVIGSNFKSSTITDMPRRFALGVSLLLHTLYS